MQSDDLWHCARSALFDEGLSVLLQAEFGVDRSFNLPCPGGNTPLKHPDPGKRGLVCVCVCILFLFVSVSEE